MKAAPRTNRRDVPRRRRRRREEFVGANVRFFILARPALCCGGIACRDDFDSRFAATRDPRAETAQRECDAGPHEDDRTRRREAGDRSVRGIQHFTRVGKTRDATKPPAEALIWRRPRSDDDLARRAIECQRRSVLRLTAVAFVDGEHHGRAIRIRGGAH